MLNVCFLHLQASASLVPATPNPPRSGLVKARLLRVAGCFSVESSLAEYFLQLQLQFARLLRVAGCFSVESSLAEFFLQLQLQLPRGVIVLHKTGYESVATSVDAAGSLV